MTAGENLLSRWARLKRKSDAGRRTEPIEDGAPRDAAAAAGTISARGRDDETIDQPFDLASLPSIETITGDTDIRGFLQSCVPAELTRAALRQAWASDPAIRDFIGIAENQWDFNDPAAMPGFGPLPASDNVPALLARAIGASDQGRGTMAEISLSLAQPPAAAADREHVADAWNAPQAPDEGPSADTGIAGADAATESARTIEANDEANHPSPNRRYHGGALPR
jgi:Protein of unknown function (DUF3306)